MLSIWGGDLSQIRFEETNKYYFFIYPSLHAI